MAEEYDDDQHEEAPSALREAAERGRRAVDENEVLRKELAFVKAGIDTDSKLGQLLFRTYEGDLTVDAIKAEAADIPGLLAPTPAPQDEPEMDPGLQQMREGFANGEPTSGEAPADAKALALGAFNDALKQGFTRDDAAVEYFGTLLSEAANGNRSAIFDRESWNHKLDLLNE
jgi:hypothetical protein